MQPISPGLENIRIIHIFLLSLFLTLVVTDSLHAQTEILQNSEVIIFYEHGAEGAIKDVLKTYSSAKKELEKTFGWPVDFRPEIHLIKGRSAFRKMAGNEAVVALAQPANNLIFIDTSRAYDQPFTLDATLRHELCHLLLHNNIKSANLPRWLDEGVCQWASGGIAEIVIQSAGSRLAQAAASGRLILLRDLETFPSDEQAFTLAYEESRGMIEYLVGKQGTKGLLSLLAFMKEGYSSDEAMVKSLSFTTSEIELKWRSSITKESTWLLYISNNLDIFLFLLAALVTVCGFIKMMKRKRDEVDREEEEEAAEHNEKK